PRCRRRDERRESHQQGGRESDVWQVWHLSYPSVGGLSVREVGAKPISDAHGPPIPALSHTGPSRAPPARAMANTAAWRYRRAARPGASPRDAASMTCIWPINASTAAIAKHMKVKGG